MKSIVINIPSNRLELENRMDIPSKNQHDEKLFLVKRKIW
jgi:hypothetical protein